MHPWEPYQCSWKSDTFVLCSLHYWLVFIHFGYNVHWYYFWCTISMVYGGGWEGGGGRCNRRMMICITKVLDVMLFVTWSLINNCWLKRSKQLHGYGMETWWHIAVITRIHVESATSCSTNVQPCGGIHWINFLLSNTGSLLWLLEGRLNNVNTYIVVKRTDKMYNVSICVWIFVFSRYKCWNYRE